ncbi:MAG: hypothetical protein R5N76_01880, partial [Cutibacterium granulosum]|nr:hypothetical protein [Cutibacterium granulosum]
LFRSLPRRQNAVMTHDPNVTAVPRHSATSTTRSVMATHQVYGINKELPLLIAHSAGNPP